MSQKEIRGFIGFLFAQHIDRGDGCVEGASNSQHTAALNGVKALHRDEVQPIHAEGGRERAKGGEQICDGVHFPPYLRVEEHTDRQHNANDSGPDPKGSSALP